MFNTVGLCSGVSKPLSIYVDLFDNDEEKYAHGKLIKENFDLSPGNKKC